MTQTEINSILRDLKNINCKITPYNIYNGIALEIKINENVYNITTMQEYLLLKNVILLIN